MPTIVHDASNNYHYGFFCYRVFPVLKMISTVYDSRRTVSDTYMVSIQRKAKNTYSMAGLSLHYQLIIKGNSEQFQQNAVNFFCCSRLSVSQCSTSVWYFSNVVAVFKNHLVHHCHTINRLSLKRFSLIKQRILRYRCYSCC